jgi:hypothetical protein
MGKNDDENDVFPAFFRLRLVTVVFRPDMLKDRRDCLLMFLHLHGVQVQKE